MYWPIGVPRVFAASSIDNASCHIDGAGEFASIEFVKSPFQAEVEPKAAPVGKAGDRNANASRPTSSSTVDIKNKDEIIAADISRNSSVLVTITTTTLHVWQTKVSHCNPLW